MINVTKCFLPPKAEYEKRLEKIWETNWLTNQGPLLQELEMKLKKFLDLENFHFVSNGTIAIQLAIQALDLYGSEIITTPFSFVATTSCILWEHCIPIFVDIEPENFNIDPNKIEVKITKNTKAILATHVFGYPCNVTKIEKIARKYNLKVIYDAAHTFGAKYKGKSVLSYGDIATCSFHATKVFHTIEGGCVIANDPKINKKIDLLKKFGFENNDYVFAGINAKNSEFHAAMGLAVFEHLAEIIEKRKAISEKYDSNLKELLQRPKTPKNFEYNYIYYPVIFDSEEDLLKVFEVLKTNGVFVRRYFYPSLNTLPYVERENCPISESISKRIACLPLDTYLEFEDVDKICRIIKNTLNK